MSIQQGPFDPLEFLKFANILAASDVREVTLRAAIGRAYYALFLYAKAKLRVPSGVDIHKRTIEAVKSQDGYLATGEKLDALKRLRTRADYHMLPINVGDRDWAKNWAEAQALANQVEPRLKSLR